MSGSSRRGAAALHSLPRLFAEAARAAGGVTERRVLVAGQAVSLRFAGPALSSLLTTAFDHLPEARATVAPDLTIHVWDEASTGVPAPVLPDADATDGPVGLRVLFGDERMRAVHQPGQQCLSVLDQQAGQAWYWAADAATLPYWENGAPFRILLNWFLAGRGVQFVHAGAVGGPDGGVLLAGKGGSGKSTTTLLCLRAAMRYVGDDYVAVSGGPVPHVHSLYGSAKLEGHQLDRFPDLSEAVANPDRPQTDKAVVFVGRRYPERLITDFPLRAVVLPRIRGGTESTLRPVPAAAALAALAPSTIFQLPGTGAGALRSMADVLRGVPAYVLDLGTDLDAIPPVLQALLDRVVAEVA